MEVRYMGTRYSGFQIQKNAPTIQSEVEQALAIIFRIPVALTGSSRTDAGVHARQNFFHFDFATSFPLQVIYNLNALLPADISVGGVYEVADDFHARFHAVSRKYNYFVYQKKNPFYTNTGYYYPYPLSHEKLSEAAAMLIGSHNFCAFSKANTQVNNFVCTIVHAGWSRENDKLVFSVVANRFLRGMVRALVATMLKCGRGILAPNDFKALITAARPASADFSAPACGLFLEEVNYPPQLLSQSFSNKDGERFGWC